MERTWALAAGLLVAGVVGAFLLWPSAPASVAISVNPPRSMSSATLTVHVSGMVGRPGLVSLPPGARIADAIAAAGGALPGADLRALNLAATVADGQQLVVPDQSPGDAWLAPADGRVRVNTADRSALESLPGVGPVLAGRIVEYRERNGPFAVVEDLLDVPGIGEAKLAGMRDSVIVP